MAKSDFERRIDLLYLEREWKMPSSYERIVERQTEDELAMQNCVLRAESVRGLTKKETMAKRRCWVDGTLLSGRQQRWCSKACVDLWIQNHQWYAARPAALERDAYTCQNCGRMARHYDFTADEYNGGDPAVLLEVNHKDPLVGHGYHENCRNHLDGLETLCHECHVDVTNGQRLARATSRRAVDGPSLGL